MATALTARPDHISDDEWQVRTDLAACYRLFVKYGWTDLIFTHLSVRVPGHAEHYLINPYGLLFGEITASMLVKADFDGNVLDGDHPYNDAGHAIHTAIYKARPDVNCVLHSHTRAGMAVSCMDCGLLPLVQQSGEMSKAVRYHDYDVATDNEDECRRLGEDMADGWVMIMRNHGLLATGRSVAEAFYLHYTLENACKVQVDVLGSGQSYCVPGADAVERLVSFGHPPPDRLLPQAELAWDSLIRLLDRTEPSYRT